MSDCKQTKKSWVLNTHYLCGIQCDNRGRCFPTLSTVPLCLAFLRQQRKFTDWHTKVGCTQECITFPCLCHFCLQLFSHLFQDFLYRTHHTGSEQRKQLSYSLFNIFVIHFGYLVLLHHPVLILFWRGLPRDNDGSPIVPTLCHCNLTGRGTGGWLECTKEETFSYPYTYISFCAQCSLFAAVYPTFPRAI